MATGTPKPRWPSSDALSHYATVAAAIFAAASAGISAWSAYQSRISNQAAQRAQVISNVRAATEKYLLDRNAPLPLLFSFHYVAQAEHDGLLSIGDMDFVNAYMDQQSILKGDRSLCCEWQKFESKYKGTELASLMSHASSQEQCAQAIRGKACV
jgi:hypothetical protein